MARAISTQRKLGFTVGNGVALLFQQRALFGDGFGDQMAWLAHTALARGAGVIAGRRGGGGKLNRDRGRVIGGFGDGHHRHELNREFEHTSHAKAKKRDLGQGNTAHSLRSLVMSKKVRTSSDLPCTAA